MEVRLCADLLKSSPRALKESSVTESSVTESSILRFSLASAVSPLFSHVTRFMIVENITAVSVYTWSLNSTPALSNFGPLVFQRLCTECV